MALFHFCSKFADSSPAGGSEAHKLSQQRRRVIGQRLKLILVQTWLNTGISAWFTEVAVK